MRPLRRALHRRREKFKVEVPLNSPEVPKDGVSVGALGRASDTSPAEEGPFRNACPAMSPLPLPRVGPPGCWRVLEAVVQTMGGIDQRAVTPVWTVKIPWGDIRRRPKVGGDESARDRLGVIRLNGRQPQTLTEMRVRVPRAAKLQGKHALYFVFESKTPDQSLCELEDFVFARR